MRQLLTLVLITIVAACAGPRRIPSVPPIKPESDDTLLISIETEQAETGGSQAGASAVLSATSTGDPALDGEVKLDIGSQGSDGARARTLQIDRETWREIIRNPQIWTVEFKDGRWSATNKKAAPEPSSALPLSADTSARFSSSRSAKIDVTLDASGKVGGTFVLENDAVFVGFGASAAVELLGQDGAVLETLDIPRVEIPGKPPGKAIQRRFPVDVQVRNLDALSKVQDLRVQIHGG